MKIGIFLFTQTKIDYLHLNWFKSLNLSHGRKIKPIQVFNENMT